MTKLHYMKVKIKTLTEEARFIRREELKQKGWFKVLTQTQSFRHAKDQPRPDERTTWPEIKNAQEKSDEAYDTYWGLREHRVRKLRETARINHLAYGFLRGVPFEKMETTSYDFPDLKKIEETARRFFPYGDNQFKWAWDPWVDAAKVHFENKGNLNPKKVEAEETKNEEVPVTA